MTLNIVLASASEVHVGADFRLTDANTGDIVTERSPKVLVVREPEWEGVITYCGVGRWENRETSDWVKGWVQHAPDSPRTFEATAHVIEQEGTRWLRDLRRRGRYRGTHSFVLAALVRGRARIALISNYCRLHGQPTNATDHLISEFTSPRRQVLVTGMSQSVSRDARRELLASLRAQDDVSRVQRRIGRVIERASASPDSHGSISQASFAYSILPNGRGQGHLHGDVTGALEIISLHDGMDVLGLIRSTLGPAAQIVPTAHAVLDAQRPLEAEQCTPELANRFDIAGEMSGFRLVELPDLGSRHACATSINLSRLVVGQSNLRPHSASCACTWQRDEYSPRQLIQSETSSWAVDVSDKGEVAGTLHIAGGGTRAFLALGNGDVYVGETLGGFHSNAHAMNNNGVIVGGSWSLPGNTPGDKRERAFLWRQGEPMVDLGALGVDWCSRAVDINDHGVVVGYSFPRGLGGPNRAFIWTQSRGMIDIGTLGGASAVALRINNLGAVIGLAGDQTGSASFIWTWDSGMQRLPLQERGSVRAINDRGNIVYTRETPQGARAVVRIGTQEIALPCYRGHQSEASAINNNGDIVGHIWRGNHGHATLWAKSLPDGT